MARRIPRKDAFHEEGTLPLQVQTRPEEYKRSCFDRGHNIPSANAPTSTSQYSTFSMANISPQSPAHNSGIWERIETATREFARQRKEVYVVTGPMFLSQKRELLNGRISVPTHFFKAVFDPSTGEAGVYVSANSQVQTFDIVSVDFLTKLSGVDPFPAMLPAKRSRVLSLPHPGAPNFIPRSLSTSCNRNPDGTPTTTGNIVAGSREFGGENAVSQAAGSLIRGALRHLQ